MAPIQVGKCICQQLIGFLAIQKAAQVARFGNAYRLSGGQQPLRRCIAHGGYDKQVAYATNGERMDIEGKVAVVTGGASGLGRATAQTIIDAGGKVAILDRNAELAQQSASELGTDAAAFAVDVTEADSAAAAINAVMERFGAIHIDVNCAGIGMAGRTVGRDGALDLAAFNFVIQVNLVGTFNTLRLCAVHMAKNEPDGADGERGRHHQHRIGCGLRRPDRPGRI